MTRTVSIFTNTYPQKPRAVHPRACTAPEFHTALATILAAAKKHGIAPGIHTPDAASAARRIAEGWQFVAISTEAGLMLTKTAEIVKQLGRTPATASVKY